LVTMIHNIKIQYKILLIIRNTDTNTVREHYIKTQYVQHTHIKENEMALLQT